MKIKDGFILSQVAGETVALSANGVLDLNMMIALNETAKFLWEKLAVGAERDELVEALLAEYEIERERAEKSVDTFVARLKELDFLA